MRTATKCGKGTRVSTARTAAPPEQHRRQGKSGTHVFLTPAGEAVDAKRRPAATWAERRPTRAPIMFRGCVGRAQRSATASYERMSRAPGAQDGRGRDDEEKEKRGCVRPRRLVRQPVPRRHSRLDSQVERIWTPPLARLHSGRVGALRACSSAGPRPRQPAPLACPRNQLCVSGRILSSATNSLESCSAFKTAAPVIFAAALCATRAAGVRAAPRVQRLVPMLLRPLDVANTPVASPVGLTDPADPPERSKSGQRPVLPRQGSCSRRSWQLHAFLCGLVPAFANDSEENQMSPRRDEVVVR